ncbi:hypothetical protein RJ641_014964 [Dillenia turbinata]|uniref:Uncharacterized protein n=1 Tax=Dillenia turbinata TaxID=194707 RepID=A0AAN8Z1P0_9MAGN
MSMVDDYKYLQIKDAITCINQKVNLIGVILEFGVPKRSKGTEKSSIRRRRKIEDVQAEKIKKKNRDRREEDGAEEERWRIIEEEEEEEEEGRETDSSKREITVIWSKQ